MPRRSTITFHSPYNDVGGILILVVCSNLYPPGITNGNVRFSLSTDYLSECTSKGHAHDSTCGVELWSAAASQYQHTLGLPARLTISPKYTCWTV